MKQPSRTNSASSTVTSIGGANRPPEAHLSEHLSNERTYLAYLRTAIALIGFGVTINRFSVFLIKSNKIAEGSSWGMVGVGRLGLGMVFFGLALVIWASAHFTHVSRGIDKGNYRPSRVVAWVMSACVVLGGGMSLVWLFSH